MASGEAETLVSNIGIDGGAFLLGGNTDGSEPVFTASGFGAGLGGLSIDPYSFNTTVYRWTADGTPAVSGAPAASSLTDQVVRLYRAYFGRPPDTAGLDYWTAQLAAGVSRGQVMVGFSDSAEFIEITGTTAPMSATEGAVRRMYFTFFAREPIATELVGWTQQINAGSTLDGVAVGFGESAEFDEIYGGVEPGLICVATIRRVLGRQPAESDYERWLAPMEQQLLTIPHFLLQLANESVVVLETGTAPLGG